MICISGLVGFLLILTAEARVGNSSELWFCTETPQCLLFDPVCMMENFEVRRYGPAKWVSTVETSYFMEMASMRAFKRLFKYISGDNESGSKIEMTAPVIVKMVDRNFWQMGVYTMSFLLPAEHQQSPPKPTDDQVFIQNMPDMTVYVRSYGGWMLSVSDRDNANRLLSDLKSAGEEPKKGFHYAVGYNSPMTIFKRHNEVWFIADDDPACSSSSEEK